MLLLHAPRGTATTAAKAPAACRTNVAAEGTSRHQNMTHSRGNFRLNEWRCAINVVVVETHECFRSDGLNMFTG